MALDDSALLETIEMLHTADGGELMRRLLGGMLQAWSMRRRLATSARVCTSAPRLARPAATGPVVTTAAGDLTVKIPKVRTGLFFPALLCPGRRIDVALHAVVMQAYVEGVSQYAPGR